MPSEEDISRSEGSITWLLSRCPQVEDAHVMVEKSLMGFQEWSAFIWIMNRGRNLR